MKAKIAMGLASLACVAVPSAQPTNAKVTSNVPTNECVKWTWSGDVYSRKVTCLEWRKKEEKKK